MDSAGLADSLERKAVDLGFAADITGDIIEGVAVLGGAEWVYQYRKRIVTDAKRQVKPCFWKPRLESGVWNYH